MSNTLHPSPISDLSSVFSLIGDRWMLITAEYGGRVNTMTASWGCFGILWNRPICACFIRPGRFTHELVNRSEFFSFSFLPEVYRNALRICGTVSGRDTDKFALSGLTVDYFIDNDDKKSYPQGVPYISQAETVIICRKIYADVIRPDSFLCDRIPLNYPNLDYHSVFVSEICEVLSTKK